LRICASAKKGIALGLTKAVQLLKEDEGRITDDIPVLMGTILQCVIAEDSEREQEGLPPLVSDDDFLTLYEEGEKMLRENCPELFQKRIITV
jgi:hypothetical protein